MKRNGFALAGYFGFGNAGDELISRAVRAAMPGGPWSVLGEDVGRWNPLSLSGLFGQSKALLYGGGELFQTRTSRRSIFYYAGLPLLARILGARFFAYGMGLDPDLKGWALSQAVAALNRAERIWFRDEESLGLFRKSGGRTSASVAPDPAWTWPVPDARLPSSLGRILWVPRGPHPPTVAAPVLLLHPAEDGKRFSPDGPIERWGSLNELVPLMSRYDAVVSMRYHGLLLAALAGRPSVAVAAHGKVAGLARELGCPVLRPGFSDEELKVALEESFRRRVDLLDRVHGFRERARLGLSSLSEVLRSL